MDDAGAPVAVEISTIFRGVTIGTRLLGGTDRGRGFRVGSEPGVDAPADPADLGAPAHTLVEEAAAGAGDGAGWTVVLTPRMECEVSASPGEGASPRRGPSFGLPAGAAARVRCGEVTFLVSSTRRPPKVPAPLLDRRRLKSDLAYLGAAAALLASVLSVLHFVRVDGGGVLHVDRTAVHLDEGRHRWALAVLSSAEGGSFAPALRPAASNGPAAQSPRGERRSEQPAGAKRALAARRAASSAAPSSGARFGRVEAREEASRAGILGILSAARGTPAAIAFQRESALGEDAAGVLAGLVGPQLGSAYSLGGLALAGTGAHGGGTGEGTIGFGSLHTVGIGRGNRGGLALVATGAGGGGTGEGTISLGSLGKLGYGRGNGGGFGSGYGSGAGGLAGRRAGLPDVIASSARVRGGHDADTIRRIVRLHINEVRYCYERELARKPDLAGRLVIDFTIAASGQVGAAMVQSSTVGNAGVERCTIEAVRRWEFPRPLGGGIAIVSYPFVLTPAGA
jgi:TonB family protein